MSDIAPSYDERTRRDGRRVRRRISASGSEPESRPARRRSRSRDAVVMAPTRNTAVDDGDDGVRSDRARERYSQAGHRSSKSRRESSPSGPPPSISRRRNVDRSPSPRRIRPAGRDISASPLSRRQPRTMSSSRSPPPKRRHRSPSNSRSPPRRRRRFDDDETSKSPPRRRREESDRSKSPPRRYRGRGRDRSPRSPPRRVRKSDVSRSPPIRPSYDRSLSPPQRRRDHGRDRDRSRSPIRDGRYRQRPPEPYRRRRDSRSPIRSRPAPTSRSPSPVRRRGPLRDQVAIFREEIDKRRGRPNRPDDEPPIEKQTPNYNPTGILAKESNRVQGTKIVLKYHEPPEARKPPLSKQWRLYIFKGDEVVDTILLYQRSCWLIGREAAVADIRVDHPSISGQHAAIQFRNVKKKVKGEFGEEVKRDVVRPYIIDLESSNGTFLNGDRIEKARYLEVKDKDIIKLGGSDRDYVFMLPPKDD